MAAKGRLVMITTYERGKIAGQREMVLLQLAEAFGPLSNEVKQRVEAMSPEELRQLLLLHRKAQSLKEVGLEP
jgi:hypothetical protein